MEWDFILYTLLIGLAGGLLGGLLGIGGSIVVIPLLTFTQGPNQQLYQAAAMIMNVAVAASATLKHYFKHAIPKHIVLRLLPTALIGICVGVALSNAMSTYALQVTFAIFLGYLGITELMSFFRTERNVALTEHDEPSNQSPSHVRTWIIGGINGTIAGLLGIGGGIILVPLLRRYCGLGIRHAIAASSATMLITATIGAIYKNLYLPLLEAPDGQALQISTSLLIAAGMIPTAFIGSYLGAGIMHRIPIPWVKGAFAVLIIVAAIRMAAIAL